jgi:hypothetical protein
VAFVVVIIAGSAEMQGSKRLDIVIAVSFLTKNSKRFFVVA